MKTMTAEQMFAWAHDGFYVEPAPADEDVAFDRYRGSQEEQPRW